MSEKKVEVTIPEPEKLPEQTENKEPELQAKAAEESKEESKEHKEESKEAAETATEAAKVAKETSEKAEKLTSYNEFAVKGLMDSISLVAQRMEQAMQIIKQMAADFQAVTEELRVTTEVHQEQIGQIDETTNKLLAATAALVQVHEEMMKAEE